jgi:general secretion pathway protein L
MSLIEYAGDLLAWWRWEAAGMSRGRAEPRLPAAVLRLGRSGTEVAVPGAPPVMVAEADAVGPTVLALAGRAAVEADLLVEPDRHLRRPLSPLRLPRSRARAMSRLDFAAETPFTAEEAVVLLPEYDEAAPESAYHIVRRRHLEPVLASLRAARIGVGRLGLVEPDRIVTPDRESLAVAAPPSRREAWLGRAARWAAVAAAVGLVAAFGAAHWRYAAAIDAVEAELTVAQERAAVVRRVAEDRDRQISRIAAARSAKSEAVPLVRILEEMARTIPDGTWLTELDFRDDAVTFGGVSQGASALIPLLEASPLFRAPTFSQPVVRADEGGERFTITMQVEEPVDG